LNVCIGSAAIAQPAINLTAFSAAANAAFGTTLSPVFSYATANLTFLDSAFLLEDVGKLFCPVSNTHLFLSVACLLLAVAGCEGGQEAVLCHSNSLLAHACRLGHTPLIIVHMLFWSDHSMLHCSKAA